jgi:dihydrofolate reductase
MSFAGPYVSTVDRRVRQVTAALEDREITMGKLVADMAVSLDGYVADANDGIEELFGWYFGGDTPVPTPGGQVTFMVSEGSAKHMREGLERIGALIGGRRIFDLTQGWGGNHPLGVPVFIVSHSVPEGWPREGSSVSFVDHLDDAVAQAKAAAGDKDVAIATPDITRQLLDKKQLDEVSLNLVPVLLGEGIPCFANLTSSPIRLAGPEVTEGTGVTHLKYRVTYA